MGSVVQGREGSTVLVKDRSAKAEVVQKAVCAA